jgi:hypothetical protein
MQELRLLGDDGDVEKLNKADEATISCLEFGYLYDSALTMN